jgi:hypothetical protein
MYKIVFTNFRNEKSEEEISDSDEAFILYYVQCRLSKRYFDSKVELYEYQNLISFYQR